MTKRTLMSAAIVAAGLIASLTYHDVFAQDAGALFAEGLNGPMGIMVAPDGSVYVVDSGVGGDEEMEFPNVETHEMTIVKVGPTSRVVRVASDGTQADLAYLPSMTLGPGELAGGCRLAMIDGTIYATSGVWLAGAGDEPRPLMASLVKIEHGEAKEVVNAFGVERRFNPDGLILESNPFGLTAGPDGMLWVVDSGANSLLKVDPETGAVEVVAAFEGIASPLPNPNRDNRMESDPVPTAVVFDDDGNAYVSLLPGFPFIPGSAKVVKVSPDGTVTDYATGLTMLVDLRRAPDGEMYAVSLGRFTEQGPVPNSGAIVLIREGDASEELLKELSFPTSIDFNKDGDAYVTVNGIGAPGTGQVLVYEGLGE